ncbi:MAG: CPBP family intramembrane glutamic endopeptidase [Spirochaetia bacterium]
MEKNQQPFSNNASIANRSIICKEIILTFSVFFLPGIIAQTASFNPELFNRWEYHLQYLIISLPQIFLLLYILSIRKNTDWEAMGIKKFRLKDALMGIPGAVGIFIILSILSLILLILPAESQEQISGGFRWEFTNYGVIPLMVLSSFVTGYREELFFRSYLIHRFEQIKLPVWGAVILSGLLFSIGHFYQGWAGFLVSFSIGLYFGALFVYRRNLHFLAAAHGLYNIAVLLLSDLMPEGNIGKIVDYMLNIR